MTIYNYTNYIVFGSVPAFIDPPTDVGGYTQVTGILSSKNEIVGNYGHTPNEITLGWPTPQSGFVTINGVSTTINPAGSISTSVLGVDSAGDVIGNYWDSGDGTHGFIYNPTSGSYTQLDDTDNNGVIGSTFVTGFNADGKIVGTYSQAAVFGYGPFQHGFIYNGGFTTIDPQTFIIGQTFAHTYVTGINDKGVVFGNYDYSGAGPAGGFHAFTYDGGYGFPNVAPIAATSIAGIDNAGDVIGAIVGGNGTEGILDSKGVVTPIIFPGPNVLSTGVLGITPAGEVYGYYSDLNRFTHGFTDNNGNFTTIDYPGGFNTVVTGIDAAGDIFGTYSSFHDPIFTFRSFIAKPIDQLFTTGPNTVDFNNLTADQMAQILGGSDIFHGLGGNDVVTLPNEANYNQIVGVDANNNPVSLGWTDTSASTFSTGSQTGDNYNVSGSDGSYFVVAGAGQDTIEITGDGNNTITAGSGQLSVTIIGNGDNTIVGGSSSTPTDQLISLDGTGHNTIDGISDVVTLDLGPGTTLEIKGSLDDEGALNGDFTGAFATGSRGALASGPATVTIDDGATLELDGSAAHTDVMFSGVGTLTLSHAYSETDVLLGGLAIDDKIILRGVSPTNGNAVVDAEIDKSSSSSLGVLSIGEGTSPDKISTELVLPINDATSLTDDFLNVSKSDNGADTILTVTHGNPIALALNVQNLPANITGKGITIGIISDSFNVGHIPDNLLSPQVNVLLEGGGRDEGRAMAAVIAAIAPGATIDFCAGAPTKSDAAAVHRLQQAGCQIIVDDELDPYPEFTNAAEAAVLSGVTYITCAGNYRETQRPIYGHAADPLVETVAAMNWLAVPKGLAPVGGYASPATDYYSSIGAVDTKPDITGLDGGLFWVHPGSPIPVSTFRGTSAAAPAVAAVAALMMQANPQLKNQPLSVDGLLNQSAVPFGESTNMEGAGLVQADAAVALATNAIHLFVDPPGVGPTVSTAAVSQPAGNVTTGSVLQFFITLNEGVTVSGGVPALVLNDGATAAYDAAASQASTGQLVFDYTVAAGQHIANLAVTNIAGNGATITDASAVSADFTNLFNAPTGVTINSPLAVNSVTASSGGEAQAGQTVHLTLTLNEGVTLTTSGGNPTLLLDTGASATYDAANSDLPNGKLVFDYTVGSTDASPNLTVLEAILPQGTTISDAGGNNADLSGANEQATGLQIGPTFVNSFFASETGTAHSGQTVQLTFLMSTAVTVNLSGGSPTLSLNDGATATYDAQASNPATGTLVFDYTVASTDQTPDLTLINVNLNNATIQDAHGVNADLSGPGGFLTKLSINSPLLVTAVSSSQTGQVITGQTIQLTASLNAAVQDYSVDNTNGSPVLALNDGGAAFYDAAASNLAAGQVVFDYTVGAGEHTQNLAVTQAALNGEDIADANGNLPDFSAALNVPTNLQVVFVPTVSSLTAVTDNDTAVVNAGHLVTLTMTTSEAATVTGTPTLQLNDNEVAFYTGGSGTNTLSFVYVVNPLDNVPDLQVTGLNLPNGASILDGNDNSLSGPVTGDLGLTIAGKLTPATVAQEIHGLYLTLYGIAATQPGIIYWENYLHDKFDPSITVDNAATTAVSLNDQTYLGEQMTAGSPIVNGTTYFATLYPTSMSDMDYVKALYQNMSNFIGTVAGDNYWLAVLQQAEATNGGDVIGARESIAGQFVHDFLSNDLTIGAAALNVSASDYTLLVNGQQALLNRALISQDYANETVAPGGSIINFTTVTSPAFAAAHNVVAAVTSDPATVAVAITGINNAIAQQDLSLI